MERDPSGTSGSFDLDLLLHPSRAFAHPLDVVRDADLTIAEKRAILASWASDACAIETAPALRVTDSGRVVRYDEIIDALQSLDADRDAERAPDAFKRRQRRRRIADWRLRRWRRDDDSGVGSGASG
jgi:hypothetical protein